jgi:carbamoyl-phosphate synthase large subunit
VLVTGVGSTTALSVIKGLRKQEEFNVFVVGTDINESHMIAGSAFCDEFYTVPLATHPDYISALLDICKKEQVEVLIPIVDPELLVVAENRERFSNIGVTAIISDAEVVRICNDKYATFKFFRQQDIPFPETWLASEVAKPESLLYPVFVKPRDGVSSRNAFRVDTPEDLVRARNRVPNLVVQEFLEGEEYTTDIIADFTGRVFAVVPRQRLQTRVGISYKGRTCNDERLINWGRHIGETLSIRGPANIQCKVSGEKITYFEVNPRFSGSLPLTIASGVNSPLWILRLITGESAPENLIPFVDGLNMTRYWAEVFHPKANMEEV